MSELIDRQAVMESLKKEYNRKHTAGGGLQLAWIEKAVNDTPTVERKTSEWLHEYLQTAVDFGIITETQASRLMDMIDDSEDNT